MMIGSPQWLPILLALGACATTYAGGRVALRLGARLSLILGLTAGVVLGVALFDLLPEAIGLGHGLYSPQTLLGALALGMMVYMALDRLLHASETGAGIRPHLGPASLTLHSLIDGMGIGLAFHVSPSAGIVIAAAVLAHDFADGVNTVGLTLAGNRPEIAHRWLVADAIAPLIGVLIGTVVHLSDAALAIFLAAFAGAFLYIGACELMPRSYASGNQRWATLATACGLMLSYGVVHLAQT